MSSVRLFSSLEFCYDDNYFLTDFRNVYEFIRSLAIANSDMSTLWTSRVIGNGTGSKYPRMPCIYVIFLTILETVALTRFFLTILDGNGTQGMCGMRM